MQLAPSLVLYHIPNTTRHPLVHYPLHAQVNEEVATQR